MREKERQEDRKFFKDIFADLSNTMIGMTQMLVQAHYAAPQQIPFYQSVHPANCQIPQCPVQGLQIPHTARSSSPYSTKSGASDRKLSLPHNGSCENIDMNHSLKHWQVFFKSTFKEPTNSCAPAVMHEFVFFRVFEC